ncbi:MAG: hypothetical protein ACK50K_13630, partial [Betaproteobacteria bacterium]
MSLVRRSGSLALDGPRGKGLRGRELRRESKQSALRADCPALLVFMARRKTRYAAFGRCARAVAASQSLRRAARAAMNPALLGASINSRRSPRPHSPLQKRSLFSTRPAPVLERPAVPRAGAVMGRRAAQA